MRLGAAGTSAPVSRGADRPRAERFRALWESRKH